VAAAERGDAGARGDAPPPRWPAPPPYPLRRGSGSFPRLPARGEADPMQLISISNEPVTPRERRGESEGSSRARNRLARVFFSLLNETDRETLRLARRVEKKPQRPRSPSTRAAKRLPGARPVFSRRREGVGGAGQPPPLPAALGAVGFGRETNEAISGDDVEE